MDPKLKRYLEIFLVIWVLFTLIYFISYKTFLDEYCSKYSQVVSNYKKMNLITASKCKTNYFCELNDEIYESWKLIEYNCVKQRVDIFEKDNYDKYFEFFK